MESLTTAGAASSSVVVTAAGRAMLYDLVIFSAVLVKLAISLAGILAIWVGDSIARSVAFSGYIEIACPFPIIPKVPITAGFLLHKTTILVALVSALIE